MADLIHQQVGSNIMDGGIAELGHAQQIASKMVSNHSNSSHRRNKAKVVAHPIVSEKLPLDEAAKLEIKSLPNKTPVSVLQELLSRRGTTPNYELVQIEGAIHEPTFRYRVTVADVVAMGTGRSKKEAKHTAAKAILDKLIGANENSDASIINSIIENQNSLEHQSGDEKVANNPIGSLQEMCMTHHWPPPKYTMEGEEGLPHERQFTIICNILKYRQVGLGKSKKLAKRQAAFKMWQSLQDQNIVRSEGAEDDEIVQRNTNPRDHYAGLKDSKIATLTSLHSNKVSQFHKNLKSSTGVKLFELQSTCLNDGDVNLVQFLQEIASEQQFEVTYVDIEEKSISGKYQCLVQLSTLPVAVCYGSGTTSKDAQAAAAQNALEYLKIMTKKNKNFKPTTKVDQSQYKQNSNDKKFKVSVNNMADVQNVSSTVTKDSIEIKIKHYHSSTVESIKSNNDVYTNSSKGKKFKKKKVKEYTSKPTAAITQPNLYYHCDKKKTCKMPIYTATSYQNSMFDMGHSTVFQQNNLKVDENIVNDGAKIKPNVVNLQCINNISANYTGFSEACQQPAITNMLFPEASSSYSATQLNQLNHFQNCAPNNYHSSSRIDAILPQYENSAYVQSYSATDLPNNQYQFQRASSTSIQDGSLFIQNLQNQLPVTDFFDSNFT